MSYKEQAMVHILVALIETAFGDTSVKASILKKGKGYIYVGAFMGQRPALHLGMAYC